MTNESVTVNKKPEAVFEWLNNASASEVRFFLKPHNDGLDEDRFRYWQRFFFGKFFKYKDAPFHRDIDGDLVELFALEVEDGMLSYFGGRDTAKTTKVKLGVVYAALYELFEYGFISSKDLGNAKNFTTDVYNMLTSPKIKRYYGDIFERGFQEATKRQQTMSVFTTRTGVRLQAVSSLQSMRGAVEQERRPDLLIFDDFENFKTLDSLVETEKIARYRQEGIDGLNQASKKVINLGNYLAEHGNVHAIVKEGLGRTRILPIEIVHDDGDREILWDDKFVETEEEAVKVNRTRKRRRWVVPLQRLRKSKNYDQEYLCDPKKAGDLEFKRADLNKIFEEREPFVDDDGLRIYKKPVKGHRYGIGADTSEGIGKDAQTAVILDFSVDPFDVVAVYHNADIDPDDFGQLLCKWGMDYNAGIVAPERNNTGHAVLAVLKREYDGTIYHMQRHDEEGDPETKKLGWITTAGSKAKAMGDLGQGVKDQDFKIYDKALIDELFSYTKKDKVTLKPLPTRHFDLVIALMIAYQLRNEEAYVLPTWS